MVQQLDALRVAPELDATKYVAGANQIDAANERMAGSAVGSGTAIEQQGRKVSEAGNQIARLSHQYVEGYSQTARFKKGLDNLSMALETGNASAAQAEDILLGMHRRLGMVANAEDLAANGQHQLAAAVTAANVKLAANGNMADTAAAAQMRLAGATKMAAFQQRNLVFQLNDVAVSLVSGMNPLMVFAQQGSQISQIYGPEEGGIGRALTETGKMAGRVVTKFMPLIAVVGGAAAIMAGVTHDIREATGVQVSFGDVALATWQVFADGAMKFVKPALDQIGNWMLDLWEFISPILKGLGNSIIGAFDLAYRNTVTLWTQLPAALGDVAISTANAVITAMENMINGASELLNGFIRGANDALGGIGINIGEIGKVDFGEFDNPNKGSGAALESQMYKNAFDVQSTDYLGAAFGAISDQAVKNHNKPTDDELEAMEKAAEAYDKLVQSAQGRIDQMVTEREALGLTNYEATLLSQTQDLMAKAANDNIPLSEAQRAELELLAKSYADAKLQLDGMYQQMENRTPWETMAAEIANLNDMLAAGAISWDTYASAVGRVAEDMVGTYASAASGIIGQGEKLTNSLGLQGKEQFEANKAFSIANAIVAGGEAVVKSYNWGTTLGGPAGGAIAAGLSAAATAAQIAAIASTSYTSKSASSAGGGAAAAPAVPQQTQGTGKALNLTLIGNSFTGEQIAELLNEALGDGVKLNVNAA